MQLVSDADRLPESRPYCAAAIDRARSPQRRATRCKAGVTGKECRICRLVYMATGALSR